MTGSLPTPYEKLGGDIGVRQLVVRFYALMDTLPEAQGIRAMHPNDLSNSIEKLYMFLSGWLGGPQLYMEAFGHPRLRARHLPFTISDGERDAWMLCMRAALSELELDDELFHQHLVQSLQKVADHMRNR